MKFSTRLSISKMIGDVRLGQSVSFLIAFFILAIAAEGGNPNLNRGNPTLNKESVNNFNNNDIEDIEITTKPSSRPQLHVIRGRVVPYHEEAPTAKWATSTKIIVNYGEYYGFLKKDGSFEVSQLPPGSYLIEVSHPDHFYEPIRVDINSKGKMRARKVNYIQSSAVQQLTYPLTFKPKGPFKYFQVRETWRITDFLLNPMVLMMVLPLLLIMVLPKMMNAADPDTQRDLQQMQMPKYDMPELSEVMTSWLGGKPSTSGQTAKKPSIKTGRKAQVKKE